MANVIDLDFREAPPVQGGGTSKIPPGRYLLQVTDVKSTTASTGAKMVTVTFSVANGPHQYARLQDRFVFPKSATDSKFGLSRFHAFLLAIGVIVKNAKFNFDLDLLKNRYVYADVIDEERQASEDGKYPARTVSSPQAYYNRKETDEAAKNEGTQPLTTEAAAPTAAPAAAPAPAPQAAPAPAAVAAPPAAAAPPPPPPAPEPVPESNEGDQPVAEVEEGVDSLFR